MMRILVTGASGQLGNELRRCFETMQAEIGPIPAAYADAIVDYTDATELNITDRHAVAAFVKREGYDLIINCAGLTDVDGCERNSALAFAVNADGAANLAEAAARIGAKLVHVSTDYVFPGIDPGERTEDDATGPLSVYGRSKLEGEQRALAANPQTFVVRTAWLYGYVGKNFVKTMIRLGGSLDEVTVVDDQRGNPTSANDLAYEILKLALTDHYGIYHCTNEGTCSWADFAAAIMEGARLTCTVRRCTSAEYKATHPESADRPAFSSLANARLAATIGNEMRPWQEALANYLDTFAELGDINE